MPLDGKNEQTHGLGIKKIIPQNKNMTFFFVDSGLRWAKVGTAIQNKKQK